jgi:hypothetical protein
MRRESELPAIVEFGRFNSSRKSDSASTSGVRSGRQDLGDIGHRLGATPGADHPHAERGGDAGDVLAHGA